MNPQDWREVASLVAGGTAQTLYMVALATLATVAAGLPLGVLLCVARKPGALDAPRLAAALGFVVNLGRSVPFVVLLIALIPLTRLIVGTSLGSTAAVVPLAIGAIPFFARVVEAALDDIDRGRIEAIVSMGGTARHVVQKVLLPEAFPSLLAGLTLTVVMLIGFSSMAGVVGGGGLGDLAIRYGYQRFNQRVMIATVIVLILLVQAVQMLGERLVRSLAHRR
ncbi:methionine ABC transporter permease [Burkholderia alba]|uniref:methionine ABC transporter permease n=1 Tax=Burkholderia alba TaxID=2683677 RepID=UPI002B054D64|nr:methionine ABC transporter permease [Burkholderia alba]